MGWWDKYKSQCRSIARNIAAAQRGHIPPSLYRFVPDSGKFKAQIGKAFNLINDPPPPSGSSATVFEARIPITGCGGPFPTLDSPYARVGGDDES